MSDYNEEAEYRHEKTHYEYEKEQAELAEAVRLTADAVLAAADLAFSPQMTERDVEFMEAPILRIALAVLAHRKAKAEQAKERAT